MRVAAMVATRLPYGIPQYVANMRWALQTLDYDIHVVLAGDVDSDNLPKGVTYHHVPLDENKWRDTYELDLPQLLEGNKYDVIVLSQTDQQFKQRIYGQVQEALTKSRCILTSEYNGFEILDSKNVYVYPRLHDVGAIYPAELLRRSRADGISFSSKLTHPWLIEQIKAVASKGYSLHFTPMQDYPENGWSECMLEFSLWGFFNNVQALKRDMLVHFSGCERIPFRYPAIFDPTITVPALNDINTDSRSALDQVATSLAFLHFTGDRIATSEVLRYIGKSDEGPRIVRILKVLNQIGPQWLGKAELARVAELFHRFKAKFDV